MKIFSFIITAVMLVNLLMMPSASAAGGENDFMIPEGNGKTYNLNVGWKFKKPNAAFPLADALSSTVKDGKNFYDIGYDDSDWDSVSVPHAVNAEDSFDSLIADAGENSLYRGFMLYRKEFLLP